MVFNKALLIYDMREVPYSQIYHPRPERFKGNSGNVALNTCRPDWYSSNGKNDLNWVIRRPRLTPDMIGNGDCPNDYQ